MSALPHSAGLQLYFVFLAYRLRACPCAFQHLDPFGKVRGNKEPPGVTSLSLQPHFLDAGTARLIDLCVKPAIKERAIPWDWHLILSDSGAIPKAYRCCFALKRVPLVLHDADKEIF